MRCNGGGGAEEGAVTTKREEHLTPGKRCCNALLLFCGKTPVLNTVGGTPTGGLIPRL